MNKCYICNRKVKVNKKGENKGMCRDCIRVEELQIKLNKLINDKLTPIIVEIYNLRNKIHKNTL